METLALIAVAIALIWKVVDGIRMLFPHLPAIAIQGCAWGVGVIVALFLRETQIATAIAVGDLNLAGLNAWTTVLFGLGLGSSSSTSVDLVKAIDNTRTSAPGNVGTKVVSAEQVID